jgi:hypothetical protein
MTFMAECVSNYDRISIIDKYEMKRYCWLLHDHVDCSDKVIRSFSEMFYITSRCQLSVIYIIYFSRWSRINLSFTLNRFEFLKTHAIYSTEKIFLKNTSSNWKKSEAILEYIKGENATLQECILRSYFKKIWNRWSLAFPFLVLSVLNCILLRQKYYRQYLTSFCWKLIHQ